MSDKYKEVVSVLGAGSFGGLLSVLMSSTFGQPIPKATLWWMPISVLFGMGAAFIGVYLIANTDRSNTDALFRCIALALVFGISWNPVFESAKALYIQKQNINKSDESKQKAADAKASLAQVSSKLDSSKVVEVTSKTVNAVKDATAVGDPERLAEAKKASGELVEKLTELQKDGQITKEVLDANIGVLNVQ